MVRANKKSRTIQQLWRELGAILRLSPWIVGALLLVAISWQADLASATGLFQSPPEATSPLATDPIPAELPTEVDEPTETITSTVPLTPTATVEPTPEPTATLEPTATPEPTETEVPATATLAPSPTAEGGVLGRQRYVEGGSDVKFDWAMLVDSVALGLSYVWLCCGVLLFLGVPLLFLVLWVAARGRRTISE